MFYRRLSLWLMAACLTLALPACDEESERGDDDQQPFNDLNGATGGGTGGLPTDTSTPVTGGGGPGVAPDSCTQAGTAWVAAPGQNQPSACGDPLAAFKPCLEQVTARFPAVSSQVTQQHNTYIGQQLMLYAVSNNNNNITMHYTKPEGAGFQYANITFNAFSINPATEPPECTQEHNAVPGFNGGETGGETDGETGGETEGETGGETEGETDGVSDGETGGETGGEGTTGSDTDGGTTSGTTT